MKKREKTPKIHLLMVTYKTCFLDIYFQKMSDLTWRCASLSLSNLSGGTMDIDYRPFNTLDCNCFFCQVDAIDKLTRMTTTTTTTITNKTTTTLKKTTKKEDQSKATEITRYRQKYFSLKDKSYARADIEYQLNIANYDAKLKNTKKNQGHLGPNGEYFYNYQWSTRAHDGIWTLDLIELCDLTKTPEYREYRRNLQQQHRNQPTIKYEISESDLDSPIPVLIAFEKMASNHGRRLRLVNVTDEKLFHFFIEHRYYSIQSNNPMCLIDK